MKTIKFILSFILIAGTTLFAQSPRAFKYQAAVRNSSGDLITNQIVSFRVSIRDISANGTILYKETHSATTNAYGLANISIGLGTPVSGSFGAIAWGVNDKFMKIEIDPNGGSSYSLMGTSQLLNVPYSLHSEKSAGLVTMTSNQRDAIGNPYMGMQIFNVDTRRINYYDGYGWLEVTGVKQAGLTCGNPLLDSRDGTYYNTIEIGGDCWMAENLNYGVMVTATINSTDNGVIEKYCYANNQYLCDNSYGGLYQWQEMMQYSTIEGVQGVCPEDWHIPTDQEWTNLVNATGGVNNAGTNLATGGSSGFEAKMGGHRIPGTSGYGFHYVGQRAYFWSSTQVLSNNAYDRYLIHSDTHVYTEQQDKEFGFSVRCMQD